MGREAKAKGEEKRVGGRVKKGELFDRNAYGTCSVCQLCFQLLLLDYKNMKFRLGKPRSNLWEKMSYLLWPWVSRTF